jgi:N-methylhydantoinase A
VPLPSRALGAKDRAELEELMRDEYQRLFGRTVQGVALEIVNLRLFARAERGSRSLDFEQPATAAGPAVKGSRAAYFDEAKGFVETAVYDRNALSPASTLKGPAIIEEKDTTIIVPPGASVAIDAHRNVIVTLPATK